MGADFGGAVDLARAEEDEALHRRLADRVEQDLRALDVGRDELARAFLDRLLDVRLGGRVHDHVDVRDDLAHELGVADVALARTRAARGTSRRSGCRRSPHR